MSEQKEELFLSQKVKELFLSQEVIETLNYGYLPSQNRRSSFADQKNIITFKSFVIKIAHLFYDYTRTILCKYIGLVVKEPVLKLSKPFDCLFFIDITSVFSDDTVGYIDMWTDDNLCLVGKFIFTVGLKTNKHRSTISKLFLDPKPDLPTKFIQEVKGDYEIFFKWIDGGGETHKNIYGIYLKIDSKTNDEIPLVAKYINELIPILLLTLSPNSDNLYRYLNYNLPYSLQKLVRETSFPEVELNRWVKTLKRKKQIIIQGRSGTGKTFMAKKISEYLIGGNDGFFELIQFHPAYTYEDFMQGIRPQTKDGQLTYLVVPGQFLEFCEKAKSRKENCVLIIDEINRANLSQVFGELMYLLEYRDEKICLAGSNTPFEIPSNVYIIGTMNTADCSIALIDHALRRRFAFITLSPNYDVLRHYHNKNKNKFYNFDLEKLIETLKNLNKQISDPNYGLGISDFLVENLDEEIEDIWTLEIEPRLEEYFYDSPEKIDEFRWSNIKDNILNEDFIE